MMIRKLRSVVLLTLAGIGLGLILGQFGGPARGSATWTTTITRLSAVSTEQTVSFASGVSKILVVNEDVNALKLCFSSGCTSGANWIRIPSGGSYSVDLLEYFGSLYVAAQSTTVTFVDVQAWTRP